MGAPRGFNKGREARFRSVGQVLSSSGSDANSKATERELSDQSKTIDFLRLKLDGGWR
jgi:hypothetical protein